MTKVSNCAKGFIHTTGTCDPKADILPSCSTGLAFFHDRVKTHTPLHTQVSMFGSDLCHYDYINTAYNSHSKS